MIGDCISCVTSLPHVAIVVVRERISTGLCNGAEVRTEIIPPPSIRYGSGEGCATHELFILLPTKGRPSHFPPLLAAGPIRPDGGTDTRKINRFR
ncbi:hypothetical protein CDAR_535671 [Caerostris darwini]|uniref:Uncharacterized protein n=1 Tax=Caerostris darwini TaxID=1538125 RepID=A0AAV4QRD5_9ARAC|nr:hypothetical protein CDAR_535671 [Caerostris darwini]